MISMIPLSAGLLGYAFNALSNIAQAPGICLFFALLAVAYGCSGEEKPEKTLRG